ncbi:hypothetical protein ABKN59_001366 [Abortiporus biennis]
MIGKLFGTILLITPTPLKQTNKCTIQATNYSCINLVPEMAVFTERHHPVINTSIINHQVSTCKIGVLYKCEDLWISLLLVFSQVANAKPWGMWNYMLYGDGDFTNSVNFKQFSTASTTSPELTTSAVISAEQTIVTTPAIPESGTLSDSTVDPTPEIGAAISSAPSTIVTDPPSPLSTSTSTPSLQQHSGAVTITCIQSVTVIIMISLLSLGCNLLL